MTEMNKALGNEGVQAKIFTIRGKQVMMDRDLAELYGVETKVLNQTVKRNIERFPDNFMYQLTKEEIESLRSQFVASKTSANLKSQIVTSSWGGVRKLPSVFTEYGVLMLSAVIRSDVAVRTSIQVIDAFVEMRRFLNQNTELFARLDNVERKHDLLQYQTDSKFDQVFNALEGGNLKRKQGIFYDGQVFDAYVFISDLIRSAKQSIVLIDNYVDDTVLSLFTKRTKGISLIIYTKDISKQLLLDKKKHDQQYESVALKQFRQAHDRFLIIDNNTVYHIGASLKDLGKKWFAFSKMEIDASEILNKL